MPGSARAIPGYNCHGNDTEAGRKWSNLNSYRIPTPPRPWQLFLTPYSSSIGKTTPGRHWRIQGEGTCPPNPLNFIKLSLRKTMLSRFWSYCPFPLCEQRCRSVPAWACPLSFENFSISAVDGERAGSQKGSKTDKFIFVLGRLSVGEELKFYSQPTPIHFFEHNALDCNQSIRTQN